MRPLTLFAAIFFCLLFALCPSCTGDKKVDPFTLRIRTPSEATTFNPLLPMTGHSRFVCGDIFYTLGTIDHKTLKLAPLMVKSLPEPRRVESGANQGALAYDFELWEEAVWDDGKPIVAEDFVFSLKLIFHPYLPLKAWHGYFEQVQDVQINPTNPKQFTVFLSEYYILGLESLCQFPIYPAHHYDPNGALKNTPISTLLDAQQRTAWVQSDSTNQKEFTQFFTSEKTMNDVDFIMGAGPYKVAKILPGEGTVLEKKSPWWGDAVDSENGYLEAFPERIEYRFLKDEGAVETNLRNGNLDVVPSIAMEKFLELRNEPELAEKFDFEVVPFMGYNYWLLNNNHPILSDVKVRRALAYLVDYDYLKKEVYQDMYQRTIGPVHPSKKYFNTKIRPYPHDLAKAKALLTEAGWTDSDNDGILDRVKNGTKENFTMAVLSSNKTVTSKAIAEHVQKNCNKIGIDLSIDWKDIGEITKTTRAGTYDCALLATAQYPGLDDLYQGFHTQSFAPAGDNRMLYSNSEADRLIEAIRIEPDESKRNAFYMDFQELVHNDVPVVFLGTPKERVIVSKQFDAAITPNRPNYAPPHFRPKQ